MVYRIENDILRLIKYKIFPQKDSDAYWSVSDNNEKNTFLTEFPDAVVEEVDNTGYEWLDGMEFTQEQIQASEVEKAIEMGETAYKEYQLATDRDAQMLDLDYRLSLVELGLVGGETL